jgi:hypothetical protein
MAAENATPAQRQAVETIIGEVQKYLNARYITISRIRPEVEKVWDDLVFQGVAQLQLTLSNSKPFGPVRYHVAETLVGDDERQARDFLSPAHTNSIMAEIVEAEDKAGATKRMEGTLEIHDLRTLFKMIEPSFTTTVSLVQTFIWWDFEDAMDLSRFEIKAQRVKLYMDGKLTDPVREWYQGRMQLKEQPSDEDIITYELCQMRRSVESFCARRVGEPGYKRIICREQPASDPSDALVAVLANHLRLQAHLKAGNALDANLQGQIGVALSMESAEVTPEVALAYVDSLVEEARLALRSELNMTGRGGKPYFMKPRQEVKLREKFKGIVGDRVLPEKNVSMDKVPKDPGTSSQARQ